MVAGLALQSMRFSGGDGVVRSSGHCGGCSSGRMTESPRVGE